MATRDSNLIRARHERFAEEYLVSFDPVEAYALAGYTARGESARTAALRLLAQPDVHDYLVARQAEISAAIHVEQEEVVKALQHMALGDIRDLVTPEGGMKPLPDMTREEASMIQGIEISELYAGSGQTRKQIGFTKKLRFVNRLDAVKTLGQHLGLFANRHDVAAQIGVVDVADTLTDEQRRRLAETILKRIESGEQE